MNVLSLGIRVILALLRVRFCGPRGMKSLVWIPTCMQAVTLGVPSLPIPEIREDLRDLRAPIWRALCGRAPGGAFE